MIRTIPLTIWRDEHLRDVTVSSKFVYELSAYAHYKNRVELLGSKFITSNSELKEKVQVTKKIGYRIVKSVDLVSAPKEYIFEHSNYKKL
jgi:hypothetical protein